MALTHKEMVEHLKFQIDLTLNPKSKERLSKALELLLESGKSWLLPGKQAEAQRLEREAFLLLQNNGEPWERND